jgi:predicted O-linked N-acetylglucosamine transferase (SPINDLY family)
MFPRDLKPRRILQGSHAKTAVAPEAMRHAVVFFQGGNFAEAERLCRVVLETKYHHFEALYLLGLMAVQQGRSEEAEKLLRQALKINPASAEAHANLGDALGARGHLTEAVASYDRALTIKPAFAEALASRGVALQQLGRHDEALASCDRALEIRPGFAEALNSRGTALATLKRYAEALASYDQALAIMPAFVEALNNRGGALKDLERFDEALASYDRALAIKPDFAMSHYNRGTALSALRRHEEALASYDRVLAINRDFAEALNNRGGALSALGRHEEALPVYDRALALKPALAEALQNRGAALASLGRYEAAIKDLERAFNLNAAFPFARGMLLHARMHCCDWRTFEVESTRVIAEVHAGRQGAEPFTILGISDSPQDQLRCAQTWVRELFPVAPTAAWTGARYRHDRVRVAYVSCDFREHPLGHLMAALFEQHDRKRFETIAVSLGPDDHSAMGARLRAAFDRFIDVQPYSDREVAKLLREMEVDIAVDRNGFTTGARPGIFALRPAPIQVSYPGFPGTTGTDYIDYLIADEVVVSRDQQAWYTEKVVYLPDSYQANDSQRRIAERTPARSDVGLPDRGFVFCSFNNNYKITPPMFDVWMLLLRQVEGSVLWLLEGNATTQSNLRSEALARRVDPNRLVFAPRIAHEDHLARQRLADLFLDTLPCNAHTTASDALWAGLPVLTCLGTTFAGRVAASLLRAVGLPELVTPSIGEYRTLALQLARDPLRLGEFRQTLARNRETWPLFDTDRYRRHIEAAYLEMQERQQRGELPASFTVTPFV